MTNVRAVTYVSFAIPGKCLGILILEGEFDVIEAALEARRLKLSPGGGVLAMSCKETDEDVPREDFDVMWANRNRLIPEMEARVLFDAASYQDWEGTAVSN